MQTRMRLAPGEIPQPVMETILRILQDMSYGRIVLVAQDSRLIQVERWEKLRVAGRQLIRSSHPVTEQEFPALARRIKDSFANLGYGQLALVVKDGAVVQMERTMKERFIGLDGEGI